MVHVNLVFQILLFFIIISSCNSDSTAENVKSNPEVLAQKLAFPFNTAKMENPQNIIQLRSYAKDLILRRQQNLKENLFDLTYYYITPRGFSNLNVTRGQHNFVGKWLKFANDYTYQYGLYDEVLGSGIYHYAGSDTKLFMLDNDIQIEPKLWDLKSNSEFFNFLGRPMIVIADDDGHGQLLMSNFSNDGFLGRQKILVQSKNGMQIMMTLLEQAPSK